jgi:hypothetical protein
MRVQRSAPRAVASMSQRLTMGQGRAARGGQVMEGKNVQNHGCCIAWGQQHATPAAAAAAAACCRVMVQCVGSTQSALHRNYYGGDEQGKREMSLAGGWLSGRVSGLSRPCVSVGGGRWVGMMGWCVRACVSVPPNQKKRLRQGTGPRVECVALELGPGASESLCRILTGSG